jgi:hypothetical protein
VPNSVASRGEQDDRQHTAFQDAGRHGDRGKQQRARVCRMLVTWRIGDALDTGETATLRSGVIQAWNGFGLNPMGKCRFTSTKVQP